MQGGKGMDGGIVWIEQGNLSGCTLTRVPMFSRNLIAYLPRSLLFYYSCLSVFKSVLVLISLSYLTYT